MHSGDPVIEPGGGTGHVTAGLLETGIDTDRLIVVEKDAQLCSLLRRRFPQLCIVHNDAGQLTQPLKPLGITFASSVVSSLPLLSLPKQTRNRIVSQSLLLLGENGRFIQYTYGPRSPHADFYLYGQVTARIWRNFLPASVWRFQGT